VDISKIAVAAVGFATNVKRFIWLWVWEMHGGSISSIRWITCH